MGAFFDDDVFGTELVNLFERGKYVVLFGQMMGFAVVEHKAIEAFNQSYQVSQGDIQPQIHRVGGNELRPLHLVEHMVLK